MSHGPWVQPSLLDLIDCPLEHAQATGLRSLEWFGETCMTRPVLDSLLSRLPHLELLLTVWTPVPQDASDAAFCQRWQGVPQHSFDWQRREYRYLRPEWHSNASFRPPHNMLSMEGF